MYKISNFNKSTKKMHIVQKTISILIYIIIIPVIIFNVTLIVKTIIYPNKTPDFLGLKSFVIVSKSMEPTIMIGDAIFVKNVRQENLRENDIISFQDGNSINTHRIIEIVKENNSIKYKTKGDNNRKEDQEKVTFDKIEGKYIFKINGFGKITNFLKNRITLIVLLVILVFVSIYYTRISKKKLLRKEKRYEYNKNKIKNDVYRL